MSDFLLELRSEEIPARMQKGARNELAKLFRREMDAAGVPTGEITVWSTPRRLALIARDLPTETEASREEAKGPPEAAPDQAVDGFCRKNGVTRDQLEVRDVKGRATFFAVIEKPGRAVSDVLAEAIPAIIRDFAWPKSMRWGDASMSTESLRWVRPLSGIVALFGNDIVECEVDGVTSGAVTLGHHFHHSGDITIGNAADYAMKLRAAHVIVDHEEREDLIRTGAAQVAKEAGLDLVEDEGLVIENVGLTEWPIPLLGRFEEDFLTVPSEIIQLTARVNQKYFVCTKTSPVDPAGQLRFQGRGGSDAVAEGEGDVSASEAQRSDDSPHPPTPSPKGDGELANAFICTANIEGTDGGAAIVDGNRKVLAARLSDARFFWDLDRKKTLEEHAKGLERVTFHEKLGTVADKAERVAKLARWLVEEGIVKSSPERGGGPAKLVEGHPASEKNASVSQQDNVPLHHPADGPPPPVGEELAERAELANQAELAARLCKADLVTEMVGEFPELQGVMGGYYARAEGLPDAVSDAIRDHYKPVGQGNEVPTAPVTVAVSLADKIDTLASFFTRRLLPTGSKDPFALRRAALQSIETILKNNIRFSLPDAIDDAWWPIVRKLGEQKKNTRTSKLTDRYEVLNKPMAEAIIRKDHNLSNDRISDTIDFKVSSTLIGFLIDRLKVQQREAGVRHDIIDAVFALGGEEDLVRLLARVRALQAFIETDNGINLLAGYKRAANILKKEDWSGDEALEPHTGEEDPFALVDDPAMREIVAAQIALKKGLSYTPEPAEKALIDALDDAEPQAQSAIEAENFTAAMDALASLREPIDAFFEEVTVNDDDPAKRSARLDLLARFRDAVHQVADFGTIEG